MNGQSTEFSPLPKRSQKDKLHKQELKKQLRQFYGLNSEEQTPSEKNDISHSRTISSSSSSSSLSTPQMNVMDFASSSFDAKAYLNKILQTSTLNSLLKATKTISQQIQNLDSSLQKLVYENYNKFLKATSVVEEMRECISKMENEMGVLETKMDNMMSSASKIEDALTSRSSNIQKLTGISVMLKKIQFVLDLPDRISKCIELQTFEIAIQYYQTGKSILTQWINRLKSINSLEEAETLSSFEKIWKETEDVVEQLRKKILENISKQFSTLKIIQKKKKNFTDWWIFEILDKMSLLTEEGHIDSSKEKGSELLKLRFTIGSDIYSTFFVKSKKSNYKSPDKRFKSYKDFSKTLFGEDSELESKIYSISTPESEIHKQLKINFTNLMKIASDPNKEFIIFQEKYLKLYQSEDKFKDPWIYDQLRKRSLLLYDGSIDKSNDKGIKLLNLRFNEDDIYKFTLKKTKVSNYTIPDKRYKEYNSIMSILSSKDYDIEGEKLFTPIHKLSQLELAFPESFLEINQLMSTFNITLNNTILNNTHAIFDKFLEDLEIVLLYNIEFRTHLIFTEKENSYIEVFEYFQNLISQTKKILHYFPIDLLQKWDLNTKNITQKILRYLGETFHNSFAEIVKENLKNLSEYKDINPSYEYEENTRFKQFAIKNSEKIHNLVQKLTNILQKFKPYFTDNQATINDSYSSEVFSNIYNSIIEPLQDLCVTYSTFSILDRDIRGKTTQDGAIILHYLCQILTSDTYTFHTIFKSVLKDSRIIRDMEVRFHSFKNRMDSLSYRFILYYIEKQGYILSEHVKIGINTPNWRKYDVPREVREMAVSIIEKFDAISKFLRSEFSEETTVSESSTDSKQQMRGKSSLAYGRNVLSSYGSQAFIDDLEHDVRKMFDKPTSFTITKPESPNDITPTFILFEIWKIALKTIEETVRQKEFNKFGFQQMQLDLYYLQKSCELQLPSKQQDLVSRFQSVLQSVASNSIEFEFLDESIMNSAVSKFFEESTV